MIGGGILKSNRLQLVLPYKKWGDLKINPSRGGGISEDILKRAKPLWKQHYNMDLSYKIDADWKIVFDEVSDKFKSDLAGLLLGGGEFRETANIDRLVSHFSNDYQKREFIAGLVDTVGSLTKSHRRFTDQSQIISLEFKGQNFSLVSAVVKLLISVDCTPDQVLWNHPNQHSGNDRYYRSWKKGFKVRVMLDDYMLKGSFVFQSKFDSALENKKIQKKSNTTSHKNLKIEGRTALHVDQSSDWLPAEIRGLHFIHYTHFTEAFGIAFPGSPIAKIDDYEKYIAPFTILTKGSVEEINSIIEDEDYLKRTSYSKGSFSVQKLLSDWENKTELVFGKKADDGFSVSEILKGIAYICAANKNKGIKGKRVLGNYIEVVKDNLGDFDTFGISIYLPDRGTCLKISNNKFACLVGYTNDVFTASLIERGANHSVRVQEPNFSNCIKL